MAGFFFGGKSVADKDIEEIKEKMNKIEGKVVNTNTYLNSFFISNTLGMADTIFFLLGKIGFWNAKYSSWQIQGDKRKSGR